MITVRKAEKNDIVGLYRIAEDMEARHEKDYFERCLLEQEEGKRVLLIAARAERLIGYAQLIWKPLYATYRRLDIPEIQDLNVIPEERGQGTGSKLIDACEALVREMGKPEIGISVGLNQRYGAAQRLYVKKGYVPDGAGVCYDEVPVRAGEMRLIPFHSITSPDDLLTLKLVKTL
jgi:GNAT superfamily N-acetyltransferase